MLLASPVRLTDGPDLDLEFRPAGVAAPACGRSGAWCAPRREVGWPYLGYGVEFLFVPPEQPSA